MVTAASMRPQPPGASGPADAGSELSSSLSGFDNFKRKHAPEKIERLFQGNVSVTQSVSGPKHPGRPRPANLYKIVLEDKKADPAALARELAADPAVEYAEPNFISEIQAVPTDPLYPQQWAHKLTSAEPAWDITRGSPNVIVAIVDVGVDYTHEDLAANIAPGGADVVDIDVNQYVADGYATVPGEDYTTPDSDPMDFNGHGTHCAGIVAAAADNGKGVSGVAPRVKILPVRAGFEISAGGNRFGLLENDDIASGIIYATDHGADVISMSFGSPDNNSMISDAIAYAYSHGVVLVAAAGNSSLALPFYPASLPGVIAVAATNANNEPAYYSNRGYWVDLAAPGGDQFHDPQILSTVPKTGGALSDPSGYKAISGTSMACPYAAGVAALVLSKNPAWTADNVAAIMKRSVDPVGGPFYIGAGRINILKALQAASAAPNVAISIVSPANGAVFQGGTIGVQGSVGGGATNSYSVAWGSGVYPSTWTTFATGTAPVINGLLGNLNVTGFAPGAYTLRVSGFENGDHLDEFTRIQVDPALHAGWPQTVGLFGGTGFQTGFAQAPTIADVDGDGRADLLVLSNTNIYGFKHDGTALAGFPKSNPQGSTTGQTQSAAVGDLDGDGKPETVVSFEDGIVAFNSAGAQIFQTNFSFPLKNWLLQPMLVDLDGDGKKEIVQKTWNNASPTSGAIVVLTSTGAPFRSWPANIGSQYTADLRFAMTAAVDLDNDGRKEVITLQFNTATNLPALFIWNYDGTLRAGYPMDLAALAPGDNPQYGPFVADVDGDGRYEIGFLRNIGGCGGNSGQFTYVHTDGSAVTGWPAAFSDQIAGEVVSIADIDGDGKAETVFGGVGGACDPDLKYAVNVLRSDGTPMPNWPQRLPLGHAFAQTALADITGDGKPEIIVGTDKGAVYAWSSNGTLIPGFPKNLGVIQAEEMAVKSCPALGDIDGDGKLEMAATGIDGRVFVWDIDAAPSAAANEWRMYQGDAAHTGFRKAVAAVTSQTLEAENLARTASAVGSSVAVNQTGASNSAFVQINSGSAVGDWIQFTLPNLAAATYNIKVYYKSNNNRATVRATVDGANQGSVFDEYAATAAQQVSFNLGSKTVAAGNHTLRFTITGKNASSSGYTMTIDKIVLKPVTPLVFEAENLARNSNVTTAVESDVNFSGGKSVKVNSGAVGNYVGFTLPAIPAGAFDVQVFYKSANNRPKAQAKVDGTVLGATADMYSAATAFKVPFDFGNKTFTAGNHDLRLTATAKNASSTGYVMHIDKIVLVPQQ
jgi:thermitase